MDLSHTTIALYALGAGAMVISLARLKARLELSKAKHPSLAGHSRLARRMATLVPFYEYDETGFFRSDNPPDDIAMRRRAAFTRLSELYRNRFAQTAKLTAEVKD